MPWTWLGMMTNASIDTLAKWFAIAVHTSSTIRPCQLNRISPSTILPNRQARSCAQIVTK